MDFPTVPNPATVPGKEQASATVPLVMHKRKREMICFKCDREGHPANKCDYKTKADGSPLNSTEVVEQKYKEIEKRAKTRRSTSAPASASVAASGYFMSSIPTVDEYVGIADNPKFSDDRHSELQFNNDSKQIVLDVTRKHHIYNQYGKCLSSYEVLFDSCSTCDIFINPEFLSNIRLCTWTLLLKTQSGECTINEIADLPGVGVVWYYPEGSANVLSQYRMITQSHWSVHYNTDQYYKTGDTSDLGYVCTTQAGKVIRFSPTSQGLHVLNCLDHFKTENNPYVFGEKIIDNSFFSAMCHSNDNYITHAIDTLTESRKRFTKRDQLRADRTRRFQHVASHPSDATIIYAAATNSIKNSPITQRDVKLALDMLGRSKYAVQGKTTRTQPNAVPQQQIVELPQTVADYYRDVELAVDVMFVNKVPFLVSLSKNIHYVTANPLDNMKIVTLEHTIGHILRKYAVQGFNVIVIHVDIQFKALRDRAKLLKTINVVSRDEHVPDIERMIRVIKERARCYFTMLPYQRLPKMMIIHLIITVVFYINAFVWKHGVSQILSPITIVEGVVLDFNLHFHVIFGEYIHTFEGTNNDMSPWTVSSLALGPSENFQGGIRCFSLISGKILHRTIEDVTRMKMPEDAI